MVKTKVISEQFYNQNQSWYYVRIIEKDSHKMKVFIRRNAYDNQSCAQVERWDGTKWQFVYDKPIMECQCKVVSYVQTDAKKDKFSLDADELLKTAIQIVS